VDAPRRRPAPARDDHLRGRTRDAHQHVRRESDGGADPDLASRLEEPRVLRVADALWVVGPVRETTRPEPS
jgi:hypothetical protein